jgi:hypothetical protein
VLKYYQRKQYKINVFYIYVLDLKEGRKIMSGYGKYGQRVLDSMQPMWAHLLDRRRSAY